jgi:hypothetical protein
MSNRDMSAAPAGRSPRLFPLWMFWLAWYVARRTPALACSSGFLSDPKWRELYDAGFSPEQAFKLHPSSWEA